MWSFVVDLVFNLKSEGELLLHYRLPYEGSFTDMWTYIASFVGEGGGHFVIPSPQ